MKHTHRFLSLLLALLFVLSPVCAENIRTAQVFDRTEDAGAFTVRFIDIGAPETSSPGDFLILTSPEGLVMTIDSGHPWSQEHVLSALENMGITRIDYMVISHPHSDHVANTPYLMRNYEVGAVYTSHLVYTASSYYNNYMAAIAEKNLTHICLAEGESFYFGEKVLVEVLGPSTDIAYPDNDMNAEHGTTFINNNSLILKFTYGESTFLTSGDLYTGYENEVVAAYGDVLDVDLLKLNHHGWYTSSGPKWRNTTSPAIAVATSHCIYDNSIMRKLLRKGEAYVTGMSGSVCVRLYEDGAHTVVTERDYSYDYLTE